MKKIVRFASLICAAALIFASLAGCSAGKDKKVIRLFNWGDYMDETVLDIFEEETGIKVEVDYYETNEDMYLKIKNSGESSYDLCIPSDYMIKKMIDEGMLAEIDFSNVPNYKYIAEEFKNLPFDPENKYSIPYMWGTVCIAYNPDMVKEPVDSWSILWDEKYKRKIFMMDSQRDSIAVALLKLGYSINTKNEDELLQAKEELLKQKPLVLKYTSDDVKDLMANGNGALAVIWSCDIGLLREKNSNIKYAIPKEGTNKWFDSLVILKSSKNKKEAEQFIDFLCRPDIAEMNRAYLESGSPNSEVIKQLPDEIRNDPVIYPPKEVMDKMQVFEDLAANISLYDQIWTEVTAGTD